MKIKDFETTLRNAPPRSKIRSIVKDVVSDWGHWKNKPRGNPSKGYQKSKMKE